MTNKEKAEAWARFRAVTQQLEKEILEFLPAPGSAVKSTHEAIKALRDAQNEMTRELQRHLLWDFEEKGRD